MAPHSSGADRPVSMVSIASGNMDDIQIDVGYGKFVRSIGNSPAVQPSASVRHRHGSKNRDDGDAERAETAPQDDGRGSPLDDDKDDDEAASAADEIITIPESTHSFLFTEPVGSTPFLFGVGITLLSVTCLLLALLHNVKTGDIPKNVSYDVKIAQYMAILIMLLMEEEIPTGLYLLRRIPQPYLKKTFPTIKYSRFVASAVLRIMMGYIFLANVIVVLIMADGVIDIFYDVLALQFIQQLDDIAFGLSKIDAFGKRLQRATRTPFFQFELVKQKKKSSKFRKMGLFLKAVYLANLIAFLAIMTTVTVMQRNGDFQCDEITFKVGDDVWDDAFVTWPDGRNRTMKLVYSYFNGVYARVGTREGRPRYVEQRKSDHLFFDEDGPLDNPWGGVQLPPVKAAEIRYCNGHWIFTHEYIYKSKNARGEGCRWLLRSQKDDGSDLLEVASNWDLWTGKISNTEVHIECNACADESDCNLNGFCMEGECVCDEEKDVSFLGTHCETKLKENCRTIISEAVGTWSMEESDWMVSHNGIAQVYGRPAYTYIAGTATDDSFPEPTESDSFSLLYSGLRWWAMALPQTNDPSMADYWIWQTTNFHGFWTGAYDVTLVVSDPTTGDSPVGVDFFSIQERGEQFGPFGFLVPYQPAGRGLFRCEDVARESSNCIFCMDGITAEENYIIPGSGGQSCNDLKDIALTLELSADVCAKIQSAEVACCSLPAGAAKESDAQDKSNNCIFCMHGITAEENYIVPESGGQSCNDLKYYALTLAQSDDVCLQIQSAEELCCPLPAGAAKESDTKYESSNCIFCIDGITTEENYIVPGSGDQSCSSLKEYALTLAQSDDVCLQIKSVEELCCPLPAVAAREPDAQDKSNNCIFCMDGITAEDNYIVPESGGQSCNGLKEYALTLAQSDDLCMQIQSAEEVCCLLPAEAAKESITQYESNNCIFCMNGITAEENYIVPESDGQTCNGLREYALTLAQGDDVCVKIRLAEEVCCSLP